MHVGIFDIHEYYQIVSCCLEIGTHWPIEVFMKSVFAFGWFMFDSAIAC